MLDAPVVVAIVVVFLGGERGGTRVGVWTVQPPGYDGQRSGHRKRAMLQPTDPNFGNAARRLERVMVAFFPDLFQAANPANNPQTQLRGGEIFYTLWQTIVATLSAAATSGNFSNDDVGKGSSAALVALDLAQNYAVNTDQGGTETDNQFMHRVATEMSTNLVPGSVLQFWTSLNDHNLARQRQQPSSGHSPVFVRYNTDTTVVKGMRVIDQFGESDCDLTGTVTNRRIEMWGTDREVWDAANWDE